MNHLKFIMFSLSMLLLAACNNNDTAMERRDYPNNAPIDVNYRGDMTRYDRDVTTPINQNKRVDRYTNEYQRITQNEKVRRNEYGRIDERAPRDEYTRINRNTTGEELRKDVNEFTNDVRRNVRRMANEFRANDRRDDMIAISADYTNTPSSKYPHTVAIKVQDAKYKYYVLNEADRNKIIEQGRAALDKVAPNLREEVRRALEQQRIAGIPAPAPGAPKPGVTETPKPEATQPGATETPKPEATQPGATETPKPEATQPGATEAPKPQTPQAGTTEPEKPNAAAPQAGISDIEQKVINLTNEERRKNGLPDLKAYPELSNVARVKSEDMKKNNYFSHTSPTYGSPFDMIRNHGVTYRAAGENIAKGQPTPEEVVKAWMNSEGHRRNILSRNFTHIGVGYTDSGHYWTQMFVGK
ncbi:CAP domain-containing protein [Bacillus spongiae]|uniref:CAP domain-containing protein n=1 Tax=Bacillus spongiae TaxID=2683610 RepID=UPI003AF97C77